MPQSVRFRSCICRASARLPAFISGICACLLSPLSHSGSVHSSSIRSNCPHNNSLMNPRMIFGSAYSIIPEPFAGRCGRTVFGCGIPLGVHVSHGRRIEYGCRRHGIVEGGRPAGELHPNMPDIQAVRPAGLHFDRFIHSGTAISRLRRWFWSFNTVHWRCPY